MTTGHEPFSGDTRRGLGIDCQLSEWIMTDAVSALDNMPEYGAAEAELQAATGITDRPRDTVFQRGDRFFHFSYGDSAHSMGADSYITVSVHDTFEAALERKDPKERIYVNHEQAADWDGSVASEWAEIEYEKDGELETDPDAAVQKAREFIASWKV